MSGGYVARVQKVDTWLEEFKISGPPKGQVRKKDFARFRKCFFLYPIGTLDKKSNLHNVSEVPANVCAHSSTTFIGTMVALAHHGVPERF